MLLVYGKKKTGKKFRPFDMKDNIFVINLFHASLFPLEDRAKLQEEVNFMNKYNQDFIFEIRESK